MRKDQLTLAIFADENDGVTASNRSVHRVSGSSDATGRYARLKQQLDEGSLFSGRWHEVDTSSEPSSAPLRRLTHVDLFSGAGGMCQGFRQAGFSKVLSVEVDGDASDTIRRNFADSAHFHGRIEDVSDDYIEKAVGDRHVNVVSGGPPCQGFSVAGLRRESDPRNQLFRQYIRVVKKIQPDFVVMENVPGILTMQNGAVAREIVAQLADAGYPQASIRILESADFGVPQLRARTIFIANRHGASNPYPKPTHAKSAYVSIELAIGDLLSAPFDPSWNHEGTKHSDAMRERLSQVPAGGSLYDTFRDAWKRQHRGVPSMTIKENHGGVHIHYELNRVLTAREMARLQTFPDSFVFSGTVKRAYWQIGNAVPCLLAERVAVALRSQIHAILDDKKGTGA